MEQEYPIWPIWCQSNLAQLQGGEKQEKLTGDVTVDDGNIHEIHPPSVLGRFNQPRKQVCGV